MLCLKKRGRKIMAVCVAAALFFGTPAVLRTVGAKTVSAISVKLEKAEGGSILVTNASGRRLTARSGLRLYNGYRVSTGVKSYVWFSLDEKKAVKTDQLSRVEVKKEGRKNEIKVICGKIFFNVSEKLTNKESLRISTSNLSMGIRGTSGAVVSEPEFDSQGGLTRMKETIQIYDGSVAIETAGQQPVLVNAGEEVSMAAGPDQKLSLEKKKLSSEEIPSFAGDEILRDEALQSRVDTSGGFSRQDLINGTAQSRAQEEKKMELLTELFGETEENGGHQVLYQDSDQLGATSRPDDSTGVTNPGGISDGDSGSDTPEPQQTPEPKPEVTPEPTPTATPPGITLNLNGHSEGDLSQKIEDAFDESSQVTLHADGAKHFTISRSVDIGSGDVLKIGSGVFITVDSGGSIVNDGSLENAGKLMIEGELISSGDLVCEPGGAIENNNILENRGSFTNKGVFRMNGNNGSIFRNRGMFKNAPSGSVDWKKGRIDNLGGEVDLMEGTYFSCFVINEGIVHKRS